MAKNKKVMEALENVKKYKLKLHQRKFVNAILEGDSKIDAYLNYIDPSTPISSALLRANAMLKQKYVSEYFEDRKKIQEQKLADRGLWTRENSIFTLKDLIEQNVTEQKQVRDAINDEIDFLLHTLEENQGDTDEEKLARERCFKQLLSRRQKLSVNKVTNDAILTAVSELNKMHGFNEENINMFHGQVIFEGEDELED